MIKEITSILVSIGGFLSYLSLPVVGKAIRSCRDKIYSGYLRRRFATIGDSYFLWHVHTLIGTEYISIGNHCTFESGLQLSAWKVDEQQPKIVIGNHCLIRYNAHITATNSITIGDNLLTGTNVFITDNSHGNTDKTILGIPPTERPLCSKGSVSIGSNVWLGNNVCVLPGVKIGDNSIIGANSVVTKSIPANAVAAGIPAKVIRLIDNNHETLSL